MADPASEIPDVEPTLDVEKSAANPTAYWRANLMLIGSLLAVWAIVSYVCGILLVEQLNTVLIGQMPLGFWFAQQGSIYVFVVLIFVYAWMMDRIDRQHGQEEGTSEKKG